MKWNKENIIPAMRKADVVSRALDKMGREYERIECAGQWDNSSVVVWAPEDALQLYPIYCAKNRTLAQLNKVFEILTAKYLEQLVNLANGMLLAESKKDAEPAPLGLPGEQLTLAGM